MNETAAFIRVRKWVMFVNCFALVNFCIGNLAWAPILSKIAKDLHVDMGSATQLMTVFAFTTAVGLIFGGILCDRIGVLNVLIIGILCTVAPAAIIPWVGDSYSVIFSLRLVQGFSGAVLCNASPVLATWYPPQKRGVAGGLIGLSASLGGALGGLISPVLYGASGSWQQTIAWLSIPGWLNIGLIVVVIGMLKSSGIKMEAPPAPAGVSPLGKAMRAPVTWLGIFVAFCIAWSMQGTYGLAPAYLAAEAPVGLGFGPMLAGQLMLAVMIAGMVGPVIGGALLDKVFAGNPKPVMLLGFGLSALFLYGLQLSYITSGTVKLIVVLAVVGTTIQFLYPAMQVLISQIYPIEIVGAMLGLWMGVGSFGCAAAMFASGVSVAKTGNYNLTVVMLAAASLVGLIATIFIKRANVAELPCEAAGR